MSSLVNPYALSVNWGPTLMTSLGVWLDASVSGSMTDAGSGACSAWADQQGADDGATSPDTKRPTIGTDTTSGKGKLSFSSKYMTVAHSARVNPTDKLTVMVACNLTDWANYSNFMLKGDTGWSSLGWRIINNNGTVQVSVGTSGGTKTVNYGTKASMTGRQIIGFTIGTGDGNLRAWKNGAEVGTRAAFASGTLTANSGYPLLMMADTAGTGNVTGDLFEVVMAASDSQSEVAALNTYLSAKWSI